MSCSACGGKIADQAARVCPDCGAIVGTSDTRSAVTVTARDEHEIPVPLPGAVELGPLDGARFAPGRIFASRFRVVSLLGRGAMGEVYRAEDLRLGQAVALKLLSVRASGGEDPLVRFTREVRLARGIVHPNVCRVFDIGEADGWHYLSMEYVDGETLASVGRRIGRLPREKGLDVARQLCAGIGDAHERGVLHRDLKPANIMLDGRGRVRIMDFGLAMRIGDPVLEIAGTAAYMAPEQLAGAVATEQSDIYALGLVLYEIFTGSCVFEVRTFEERARVQLDPRTLLFRDGIDPETAALVRSCLAVDPAQRPASVAHVAARLPGGDTIAAALAEGRVLPPDMLASAATAGAIKPPQAWGALALILAGVVAAAVWGGLLTVTPAEVPKAPEVLAERAAQILTTVGHSAGVADRAFWFDTALRRGQGRALRFLYRTSPQLLVPQNLFHFMTLSDPPSDVTGMATVVLDLSGRLVTLSRVAAATEPAAAETPWSRMFADAGLSIDDFEPGEDGPPPLVPHDSMLVWTPRAQSVSRVSVFGAALKGRPVYFDVVEPQAIDLPRHGVFSTRRSRRSEAVLWFFVIVIFTATAVMVRRNLRAGEGDLRGAWRLALVVTFGGVLSAALHAHHVPDPIQELTLALSILGWSMVWGGFSWLSYVAFEPHARRLWPRTVLSWARVLAGRVRDPLVGRDVLVGVLAGVVVAAASVLRAQVEAQPAPDALVAFALDSLRAPRHLWSRIVFGILDSFQYALGGFFMLVFLRLVLRKTWLAALLLIAAYIPIGSSDGSPADVLYTVASTVLFFVIVLRLGLLSGMTMLMVERLLTRIPLTLDLNAWYAGSSMIVVLLVIGSAVWAFITATAVSRERQQRPVPLQ